MLADAVWLRGAETLGWPFLWPFLHLLVLALEVDQQLLPVGQLLVRRVDLKRPGVKVTTQIYGLAIMDCSPTFWP